MSTLLGMLTLQDRDTTVEKVGQQAVYDAIDQLINAYNSEIEKAISVFVEDTVSNYSETYYLPGGGTMEEATPFGALSQPAAVKPTGSWVVNYPIGHFDDAWATDPVTLAKMTIARLDTVVEGITTRHLNTLRAKLLRSLLNKTNETFTDLQWGSLTIKRLANNDTDTYPPVQGSSSDTSSHSHFNATGYATGSISNTNNPFTASTGTNNVTNYISIKDQLEEHFGLGNLVTFCNNADRDNIRALSAFVDRDRLHVQTSISKDRLDDQGLPIVPGQLIGGIGDILLFEYRWIPSAYLLTVDMMQPGPVKKRVDPEASLQGFKLVSEFEQYPLTKSTWRDRFGFGVGNRLNGYVVQLTAAGTGISNYTTPSTYS